MHTPKYPIGTSKEQLNTLWGPQGSFRGTPRTPTPYAPHRDMKHPIETPNNLWGPLKGDPKHPHTICTPQRPQTCSKGPQTAHGDPKYPIGDPKHPIAHLPGVGGLMGFLCQSHPIPHTRAPPPILGSSPTHFGVPLTLAKNLISCSWGDFSTRPLLTTASGGGQTVREGTHGGGTWGQASGGSQGTLRSLGQHWEGGSRDARGIWGGLKGFERVLNRSKVVSSGFQGGLKRSKGVSREDQKGPRRLREERFPRDLRGPGAVPRWAMNSWEMSIHLSSCCRKP